MAYLHKTADRWVTFLLFSRLRNNNNAAWVRRIKKEEFTFSFLEIHMTKIPAQKV